MAKALAAAPCSTPPPPNPADTRLQNRVKPTLRAPSCRRLLLFPLLSSPPQIASAFSHMLNLHNLTEDVLNTHTERAARLGAIEPTTRTTILSFKKLIDAHGAKPEDIYRALCSQQVELVFTAHPTQVGCLE